MRGVPLTLKLERERERLDFAHALTDSVNQVWVRINAGDGNAAYTEQARVKTAASLSGSTTDFDASTC